MVKEGQNVKVKVLEIDQRGKVRLSVHLSTRKPVPSSKTAAGHEPRNDRGPRHDRDDGPAPDHLPAFLKTDD